MADNFFDQFDPAPGGNFFDQFDPPKPKEPPKERGWGEAIADTAIGVAQGAVGMAKLVPMAVGAADTVISKAFGLGDPASGGALANPVTRGLDDIQKGLQSAKSADIQAKEAGADAAAKKFGQRFQDVAVIGDVPVGRIAAETVASVGQYLSDPSLFVQGVAQNIASVIPSGLAARGTQVAAEAIIPKLATSLTEKAVTSLARTAGVAGGVTMGAVQQGSDVASETYGKVMELPDGAWQQNPRFIELSSQFGEKRAKDQIAAELATEAGVKSGVQSLVVNAVGAKFGGATLESAFLKPVKVTDAAGKAVAGSTVKGFVKGGLGEAVTEAPEEGYGALVTNQAIAQIDPTVDVYEGVGSAAGKGAAAAFGMGAVAGARQGMAGGLISRQRALAEDALRTAADAGTAAAAANELAGNVADFENAARELTPAVDAYLGRSVQGPASAINVEQEMNRVLPSAPAAAADQRQPRTVAELRAMADRDAQLLGQADAAGTAFERRMALEQAQVARGEPAPAGPRYADLTPMTERQAQSRLAVMRDMAANEGGDSLSLAVVPHPGRAGMFAIGSQALPSLDIQPAAQPDVAPAEAQNRIEAAALVGQQAERRAEDAPRLTMVDRALRNIEARGGVASSYEAEVLRQANMGQPYDRVDPSIGRPADVDEKLTAATGIAVGQEAGLGFGARSSTTVQPPAAPFQYDPTTQGRQAPRPEVPIVDARSAFLDDMRRTNTPAAQAFMREYNAGRITDADVQVALEAQRRGAATPDQVIEQAAAQAAPQPGGLTAARAASTPRVSSVLAEAVTLYGGKPYTEQDLTVEGSTGRLATAASIAPDTATDGVQIEQGLAPRGEFRGRKTAIATANKALPPRPQRIQGIPVGQLSDAQLQQMAQDDSIPAISRRGASVELEARAAAQQARGAAARADAATTDTQSRLEAAAAQGRLAQPSDGKLIITNAKLSTQRAPAPGSTVTVNDQGQEHAIRVVDPGKLGMAGRLLREIARIFGKRLVVFESDTARVDGFVMDGDNRTIYINANSQISPLAVFGHELTHLLKRDNPRAYAAIQAVVERELGEGAMDRFAQEYGAGANLEELTSDLVGNRFQEPSFWRDVFLEIAAQQAEGARGVVMRLANTMNRVINAFLKVARNEQGFHADRYVRDLNAIKSAIKTAMVEYVQGQRDTAVQMDREAAVEQAAPADMGSGEATFSKEAPSAPPQRPFNYTPDLQGKKREIGVPLVGTGERVTMSPERSPAADVRKAGVYEQRTGLRPYTSEGQIDVPLEGLAGQFSVKRPYGDKEFAKGRTNDPLTGLPLNKNGTVTLYYPTTNAIARELARTKKLTGARPDANRIYLTNESSGARVVAEPGNIDHDLDGANVLLQVDPRLLHLDREYEDGRKDFFIPIAEGQAFRSKMTRLFTLDAPRTRALSKDTKLTDLERRIEDGIRSYLELDGAARRARLKEAKDLLRDQHNIGTLLGVNGKLEKTNTGGYGLNNYNGKDVMSMGLGLASAQKINEKNLSTCPNSAICEGLCLGETSGQNLLYGGEGSFKSGPRLAQYLKTEALVQHPEDFAIVLHSEIERFQRKAAREDYQPTVRLNVTSDFRPQTFAGIIDAFPGVMFYDYTKLPTNSIAPNHHLTYSSTGASQVVNGKVVVNKESNWDKMVEDRLLKGMNIAMAFTSRTDMPAYILDERTGERFQVWNGDNYDARFLDPKPGQPGNELNRGMIIGLTNKDKTTRPEDAAVKHNGFFLDYDPVRDGDTLTIRDQKALAGGERRTIPIARLSRSDRGANDQEKVEFDDIGKDFWRGLRSLRGLLSSVPERSFVRSLTRTGDDGDRVGGRTGVLAASPYTNRPKGTELVEWDGPAPLIGKYYTKGLWGKLTDGERPAFSFFVLPAELVEAPGATPNSYAWLTDNAAITYTLVGSYGNDNAFEAGINAARPGTAAHDLLQNEIIPTGQINSNGQEYYRLPIGPRWSKIFLTEAVRRAAYKALKVPDSVSWARDTGANPSAERTSVDSAGIEARFARQRQVDTPEFRKWFGDSAVVDANGDPLVVWRGGTPSNVIATDNPTNGSAQLGPGAYFGGRGLAEDFAQFRENGRADPYYLSLQQPFDETRRRAVDPEMFDAFKAKLAEIGVPKRTIDELDQPYRGALTDLAGALAKKNRTANWTEASKINAALREVGFDGIIADWYAGGEQYVAFKPTQIKSAIGNNGDFDPANPDITASRQRREIERDADAIAAMDADTRDNTELGDFPGGPDAYNLYEARKLLKKPSDKLKRVTDNNTFSLWQNYDFIANVDGEMFGVTKQEDPDEVDDETRFVYAFENLADGTSRQTATDQTDELFREMRASMEGGASLSRSRQTETPEFQRWFGDSKIIGADGKPLVVYHGTDTDFSVFDPEKTSPGAAFGKGIYLTEDPANTSWKRGDGMNVMPLYAKVENPLDIRKPLTASEAEALQAIGVQSAKEENPAPLLTMEKRFGSIGAAAEAAGFDGLLHYGPAGQRHILVFKPTQIKSATGNNGDFDPANPDITKSRQRVVGDSGRAYTPEQLAMFENVGRTVTTPTLKERIAELRQDLGKKMAQGIADQFRPIADLSKKAYALARLSRGSAGAFEALLHHGKLSLKDGVYDADQTGGFIERVGVPLQGELEDFLWWVAGNRAERLTAEDRERLFTAADIAAAKSLDQGTTKFDYVLQHGPRAGQATRDRTLIFRDALKTFDEFNKNTLDMAEQSGLIDAGTRPFWEHEFYVPFYRVTEEDGAFSGAKMKDGLVRQEAFKQLRGGTQKLNGDLLANTLQNWGHLIDAAAKNRAAKETLEAAVNLGAAVEADEATISAMATAAGKKSQRTWFMDGGVKRHFLIEDPAVVTALTSLDYAGLRGPLWDALSAPKHWLTVGVTASPHFKIKNLIRDSMQAIATSPLSYNPLTNIAEGIRASDRGSQTHVSALASGGLIRFGTMLEGSASKRTRQLIRMGVKDTTILDSDNKIQAMYDKFLEPAIMAYNELGNRGEEINRASLFKQLTDQGMDQATAALMARDLMDFSMQGSWTWVRVLTQLVPFMNARIQGLYKLGRAAAEDPKRFGIVLGAVAAASVALLLAYEDDDDWKKREDWDRDTYWWFKIGGTAFRIPKPFEIGAIGTLAERGLEYFMSPEMTNKRFRKVVGGLILDQLSMNPVPQVVKPIVDVYSNKDSFTGRPIETMGMERLKPEYRFTDRTSMAARALSTGTFGALSPVQYDHLIRGYFAWLGSMVVTGADVIARPVTGQTERATPDYWKLATGGLASDTESASSRYVTQMYEQAKELKQAMGTYRMLMKTGRVEEGREFFKENKEAIVKSGAVERVKAAETRYNEMIRMIERSKLDPDVKRERIQNIQAQKDRIARLVAPGYQR